MPCLDMLHEKVDILFALCNEIATLRQLPL